MSKHTPGPWFVDHKSPFLVRAGDDIDGRHIAHIGPANYTPRFDVDEQNARLISAAPDLLEALEDMLSSLKVLGVSGLDAEIKNATAVVARAKGETVSAKEIPTPAHECWFCDGTKEYQGEPCLICVEPKP